MPDAKVNFFIVSLHCLSVLVFFLSKSTPTSKSSTKLLAVKLLSGCHIEIPHVTFSHLHLNSNQIKNTFRKILLRTCSLTKDGNEMKWTNQAGAGGLCATFFINSLSNLIAFGLFSFIGLQICRSTICINSVPRVPSHGVPGREWDNQDPDQD